MFFFLLFLGKYTLSMESVTGLPPRLKKGLNLADFG